MRILLAGGGTGGPVMPLLAVRKKIMEDHPHSRAEFLLVGTSRGPEAEIALRENLEFAAIPAGKLRRYFSLKNLLTPFEVVAGFFKALGVINKFKPDVVFGAGGYVCVPVMLAAWMKGIKIVLHQQDVQPTLTNEILAPFAKKITVSFEQSLKDFNEGSGFFGFKRTHKIVWTGNPVREEFLQHYAKEQLQQFRKEFGVEEEIPVILVFGGATGAAGLNSILEQALPDITKFAYVIHATGPGKKINFKHPRYFGLPLIPNIIGAFAVADFVICRAGLSTITELSALKKAAIVIPMPNSHQLDNALWLKEQQAAMVLNQDLLNGLELAVITRKLIYDFELQRTFSENIAKIMPRDAAARIARIIVELCQK